MKLPDPSPAEQALLQREGLDTLKGAFAYTGGEALTKPGLGVRERIRLELTDESGAEVVWYLKRYGVAPPHWRLWRWFTGRARRGQAIDEINSILDLAAANVPTMRAVTAGAEVDLFGLRRSYVIVTAVPGEALERCFDDCLARWDEDQLAEFNEALGGLVARLHSAGLAHRDLYASHIFLDETPKGPKLHLIDVARVFKPGWRKWRWQVKDLAQIRYSMPDEWGRGPWRDFLSQYLHLRFARGCGRRMWLWSGCIERRAARMRRRQERRQRRGK